VGRPSRRASRSIRRPNRRADSAPTYNPRTSHAVGDWRSPRSLSNHCAARQRRNGRSLSSARSTARSRCRRQSAARRTHRGLRSTAAIRAGGAGRGCAEPSEHPRRVRRRHARGHAVRRLGAPRGRDASRAPRWRRAVDAAGHRVRLAARARTRGRARERHRPSRSEAGERLHHERRAREGSRFRSREAGRNGERCRCADGARGAACEHRPRHGARHRGLHVARAGARPGERSPVGHLLDGRRPLRDAFGQASLQRRFIGRDDARDPESRTRRRSSRAGRRSRLASSASSITASRRVPPSDSSRRTIWRSRSKRCRGRRRAEPSPR